MNHHLIFEGAELAGKSWLMSRIYDYLEPKYNRSGTLLDGCHWFNCDVGVYGTGRGPAVIKNYLGIFETLKDKNLLVEKFHLSDLVYSRFNRVSPGDYRPTEKKLKKMGFKIILAAFPENKSLLKKRIKDRLRLYPHYERILKSPDWYISQQKEYFKEINKSSLPSLVIKTEKLPDEKLPKQILDWIGETA